MSTFTVCAKRLLTEIQRAQSVPLADVLTETAYSILRDSENYLERVIRSDFQDGVPAMVAIKRPPFSCDEAEDCDDTRLCDASTTAVGTPRWETFEINDCIQTKAYKVTSTDYELACNGTLSQAFLDSVEIATRELKRKFNSVAIAYLKANTGNWVDGSTTKTLPIAAATTGVGLYPTWSLIQEQFAAVGINVRPNVLGGSPIFQIMSVYGVRNPLTGFSPEEAAGGVTMYYESAFNSSTPANQVIAWSPQSVQVVTYNKFLQGFAQGTNVKSMSDVENVWKEARLRSTGAIPVLFYSMKGDQMAPVRVWAEFEGIPDNCGDFVFRLTIRYKFVKVLTDLCNENGFNGIFTMTTCSPTIPACPEEPEPVVPLVYCMEWEDTPCESPYEVTSITLGGVTYSGVPMNYTNLASLVTIINTFVGSTVVYLEGGVIKSAIPLADGYLNDNKYPFSFSECAGS